MKIVLIILAVFVGLFLLGWLGYLLMSKPKKVFFSQQVKALPHMLTRYFV
ncbi:MAG: hypothetical protein JW765_13080 [Deltaproteobacteria bacterium]|nr:hypothetical protein [Candidatus Zymogenaceae bacterium]